MRETLFILVLITQYGSIYMSINNINPSEFFGGIWEQIKDVFLLAAGNTYEAGSTGGEATVGLNIEHMPGHIHTMYSQYNGIWHTEAKNSLPNNWTNTYENMGAVMESTGGGQAHNNMPPYITVYVWKRIK